MPVRVNDHLGLATGGWTWLMAAALVVLWVLGPAVALRGRGGLRALPRSFLGFLWVGFGVDFVIRFFVLTADSVEFGNDTFRLADVSRGHVDRTLLLTIAFWTAALVAFALPPRLRHGGLLEAAAALGAGGRHRARLLVLATCSACIVLASGWIPLPLALVTPIALVGRLWIVPAAFVWAEHWARAPRRDADSWLRCLVLAPALLQFALSPFREHLLPLALLPLLTLACVRGRFPRGALLGAAAAVVLFLAAAPLTTTYRNMIWGGLSFDEAATGGRGVTSEIEEMPDPEWLVTIRRFHGFDSFLLTVDLVPAAFPFTDDGVLLGGFVRGVLPRALAPDKAGSGRGQEFARTIWAYDSELESDAAIAPSMPGDLYRAGGVPFVLAGAAIWGLLLGLLDRWKDALAPGARAAMLALFATQVLPSVERDFAHCVATLVQTLLVLGLAGAVAHALWGTRRVLRWSHPAGAPA